MKTISEIIQAPYADTEALRQSIKDAIHCALPGKVKSFDPNTQTAVIAPSIRMKSAKGTVISMPDLLDVPVFFPGGSSEGIAFQINPGDECLVVFSDDDITTFFDSAASPDYSIRRHSLSDGFAFVGFRSKSKALPSESIGSLYISNSMIDSIVNGGE